MAPARRIAKKVSVTSIRKEESTLSSLSSASASEEEIQAPPKKVSKGVKSTKKVIEAEEIVEDIDVTPKKAKRGKKVIAVEQEEERIDGVEESPKKTQRKRKVTEFEKDNGTEESAQKPKRHRKSKEEKEAEMIPLAARTAGLKMFIGAHVSGAGGVHNTVGNAVHIGGNAFAAFLKSQRKWENPPLQDEHRDMFKAKCTEHNYDSSKHVLPHGSYLVNLAQEEKGKADQAYSAFLDDLKRCDALGIKLYNFHPGNTGQAPRAEAISRIASALNRAHSATQTVKPVLENMTGGGNIIGSTFEDLRDIIAGVKDKSRIGVCIDTCHTLAAGYDLRSPNAFKDTMDKFDKIVGMKYLCALHLNDSKAPLGSNRDLHQNIGLGFLGLRAFHNIMNDPRFQDLPLVLETPNDPKDPKTGKNVEDQRIWAREIKLLESLIGMDPESEEFQTLEKEFADTGAEERREYQAAHDRKLEKVAKASAKKGDVVVVKGKGSILEIMTKEKKTKVVEKVEVKEAIGRIEEGVEGAEDEVDVASSLEEKAKTKLPGRRRKK
ncbi:hypothetical protein MMC25_007318 [Agyrium rufum]|nr:hypothetical protein [Agyrium rufum]